MISTRLLSWQSVQAQAKPVERGFAARDNGLRHWPAVTASTTGDVPHSPSRSPGAASQTITQCGAALGQRRARPCRSWALIGRLIDRTDGANLTRPLATMRGSSVRVPAWRRLTVDLRLRPADSASARRPHSVRRREPAVDRDPRSFLHSARPAPWRHRPNWATNGMWQGGSPITDGGAGERNSPYPTRSSVGGDV